jgi:hypothetical protein
MAVQKQTISLRATQELKTAIEQAFYAREHHESLKTTSAFMEQLLEFVWLQYEAAGSLTKLLTFKDAILKALHGGIANDRDDMVSITSLAPEGRSGPKQVGDLDRSDVRKSAQARMELRKQGHVRPIQADKKSKTGTDH